MIKPRTRLCWSVGIGVIYTMLQITASMSHGKLAYPVAWDDVSYFNDAVKRLDVFYTSGMLGLLEQFWAEPPRSLTSVPFAMAGFALFGVNQWSGYALNGLFVMALLWLCLRLAARLPAAMALGVALALLGFPLLNVIVIEHRPDGVAAVATGIGVLMIVTRPLGSSSRRLHVEAGLALAIALLAKPSLLHVTLGLFFGAAVLRSCQARWQGAGWPEIRHFWTWSIGFGLLTVAPYYLVALVPTLNYVWVHTLGRYGGLWRMEISLEEHLTYYLTGPGGELGMGRWIWIWIIALVVASIKAISSVRWRWMVSSMVFVSVLAYLGLTLPPNKQPFIGLSLSALALCSIAAVLVATLTSLHQQRPVASWVLLGAILAFSGAGLSFFNTYQNRLNSSKDYIMMRGTWSLLDSVVGELSTVDKIGKKFSQTSISTYMNYDSIIFRMSQLGFRQMTYVDLSPAYGPNPQPEELLHTDFVITYSPDSAGAFSWLPSGSREARAALVDELVASGMALIRSIDDPVYKGSVLIYGRPAAFADVDIVSGLGSVEGPYPQWKLPQVRWGMPPASVFRIAGAPNSTAKLVMEVRAPEAPGQTIKATVNGNAAGEFPVGPDFGKIELPLSFGQDGLAAVSLVYSKTWDSTHAVLYRRLAVVRNKE